MIKGRLFTVPGILYWKALNVTWERLEHLHCAQTFQWRSHVQPEQSIVRLHSSLLRSFILLLSIPQNLWLASMAVSKCEILERRPLFLPNICIHREETEEHKITGNLCYCSFGAIENKNKRTSNCCIICHLVLLGCFCICLKTILLLFYWYK